MQFVAITLAVLSGLVALGNVAGIVRAARGRKSGMARGYSCVPLISFIFGATSWVLAHTDFGLWLLLPTTLDPGTWVVPAALFGGLRRRLAINKVGPNA